jgi:hypothetical protein
MIVYVIELWVLVATAHVRPPSRCPDHRAHNRLSIRSAERLSPPRDALEDSATGTDARTLLQAKPHIPAVICGVRSIDAHRQTLPSSKQVPRNALQRWRPLGGQKTVGFETGGRTPRWRTVSCVRVQATALINCIHVCDPSAHPPIAGQGDPTVR